MHFFLVRGSDADDDVPPLLLRVVPGEVWMTMSLGQSKQERGVGHGGNTPSENAKLISPLAAGLLTVTTVPAMTPETPITRTL